MEADADAQYAAFTAGLVPGMVQSALGVRMPALHSIAREIVRGDGWRDFLEISREYPLYELRMLHGMVLGGARCELSEKVALTEAFLPHIDNWAVCDGFCSSFKPKPAELDGLFRFCCRCAGSDLEFTGRFGLVMLMDYYRCPPWIDDAVAVYRRFRHDGYYARMAAAWGLATLWPHAREACLSILSDGVWDAFTQNRAIQKLCESRRISNEDKALARALRRRRESD